MPKAAKTQEEFEARFWAKVDRSDGCWEWQGARTTAGYGSLKRQRVVLYAHRTAWEITYGPITEPHLCICHKCDNRRCVRPDHLFLGDKQANSQDCALKFRGNGRANSPVARLSDTQVREIRSRYASGSEPQTALAQAYGVSQMTISKIVRGETWRRLLITAD